MLKNEWLLACAPIGVLETFKQAWKAVASGVFIYDNPFIWYVTSYQQICHSRDISYHVLLKHKKQGQIFFDISAVQKQEKISWIFDKQNNIAATLFPADSDFELKAIGFEIFLSSEDMVPAMNCYSVGYPYMLAGQDAKKVTPGVLEGIISRIDEPSKIYVTTPIFPDNYGCPLFVLKSPFDSNCNINIGGPCLYLGGIMTNTITKAASTGNDGNYFGVMSSSELIKKLIHSSEALSQKNRLKAKNGM